MYTLVFFSRSNVPKPDFSISLAKLLCVSWVSFYFSIRRSVRAPLGYSARTSTIAFGKMLLLAVWWYSGSNGKSEPCNPLWVYVRSDWNPSIYSTLYFQLLFGMHVYMIVCITRAYVRSSRIYVKVSQSIAVTYTHRKCFLAIFCHIKYYFYVPIQKHRRLYNNIKGSRERQKLLQTVTYWYKLAMGYCLSNIITLSVEILGIKHCLPTKIATKKYFS